MQHRTPPSREGRFTPSPACLGRRRCAAPRPRVRPDASRAGTQRCGRPAGRRPACERQPAAGASGLGWRPHPEGQPACWGLRKSCTAAMMASRAGEGQPGPVRMMQASPQQAAAEQQLCGGTQGQALGMLCTVSHMLLPQVAKVLLGWQQGSTASQPLSTTRHAAQQGGSHATRLEQGGKGIVRLRIVLNLLQEPVQAAAGAGRQCSRWHDESASRRSQAGARQRVHASQLSLSPGHGAAASDETAVQALKAQAPRPA